MTNIIPNYLSHGNNENLDQHDLERFVKEVLPILHRGGKYGYFWTLPQKKTYPFLADQPSNFPLNSKNVYYGVNPTNKEVFKDLKVLKNERAKLIDIVAVNTLFAEYDAKNYGDILFDLEGAKRKALDHIKGLPFPPSMIIDSGGGYHVYHFLKHPFLITDDATRFLIDGKLKTWVNNVSGSLGVNDLTRILRVPGTFNNKKDYPEPLPVTLVELDASRLYELDELVPEDVTAITVSSTPTTISDIDLAPYIECVQNRKNKDEHFRKLWNGAQGFWTGTDRRYESQSEADLALMNMLMSIARGDQGVAKKLFARSHLYRARDKADDYLDRTAAKAYEAWADWVPVNPEQQGQELITLLSEEEADNLPAPSWLIDEVVYENEWTMIYGKRGHGKTTYVISAIMPFSQKENVLYFAGEDIAGVSTRRRAWRTYNKKLRSKDSPLFTTSTSRFDLTQQKYADELIKIIQQNRYKLLVFDPITYYIGSSEMLKPEVWIQLAQSFRQIINATGVSIVVLQHEGYEAGHPKGSLTQEDLAAFSLRVFMPDEKGKYVRIKQGRPPKNSAPINEKSLEMKSVSLGVDTSTGQEVTAPVLIHNSRISFAEIDQMTKSEIDVLNLYAERAVKSLRRVDIEKATGLSQQGASDVLGRLVGREYITHVRGKPYELSELGLDYIKSIKLSS